jgi:hypothetical protein
VTLRKVPGAVALGLLASLGAHAALYGGEHLMGGAYHALLLQAALVGALALVAFFGALAWSQAKGIADGSVLATRLRERLPALWALAAATTLWYALAESLEPHHANASPVAALLALVIAAWLVERLARGAITALTGAIIAVRRESFQTRTPIWSRRPRTNPVFRRTLRSCRRFARPPPIAVPRCA